MPRNALQCFENGLVNLFLAFPASFASYFNYNSLMPQTREATAKKETESAAILINKLTKLLGQCNLCIINHNFVELSYGCSNRNKCMRSNTLKWF